MATISIVNLNCVLRVSYDIVNCTRRMFYIFHDNDNWFFSVFRDDSHCTEVSGTLDNLVGYVQTWSGFQKMKKEKGQDESAKIVSAFEQG